MDKMDKLDVPQSNNIFNNQNEIFRKIPFQILSFQFQKN